MSLTDFSPLASRHSRFWATTTRAGKEVVSWACLCVTILSAACALLLPCCYVCNSKARGDQLAPSGHGKGAKQLLGVRSACLPTSSSPLHLNQRRGPGIKSAHLFLSRAQAATISAGAFQARCTAAGHETPRWPEWYAVTFWLKQPYEKDKWLLGRYDITRQAKEKQKNSSLVLQD